MAQLQFPGRDNPTLPLYLNPNIFFTKSTTVGTEVIPKINERTFIWASVRNDGRLVKDARIDFYVCDPTSAPTPNGSTRISTSHVSIDQNEQKNVLCLTPWTPTWIHDGHQYVVCEVSAPEDPSPQARANPWNIRDRHVAQHNLWFTNPSPTTGGRNRMAVVRQGCTPSDKPAPKWQPDVDYTTSTLVRFEDRLYQCVQSHKSQTDWPSTSTPALWVTPTPCGVTKWQDQTSYKAGSRVTYQGKTYQCLQAHTSLRSWEPPLTPALWKEVDPTTPDPDPTPTPDPGYTIAATFSTVGMYNQPATRLVVRPADPDALAPALRLVGVDGSNVSDWAYHDDGIYTHNRRRTLYISASFVKHPSHRNLTKTSGSTDKTMFIGPELYVIAILISDKGQRVVLELRDDGAQTGKSQPNSGVYVVSTPGIRFEEGNWYLFVVSQDTNTVIEGTEPRIAAKTIGGLVLTNQYSLRFDQEPCQLDHDAVITMITGAAEPISIR